MSEVNRILAQLVERNKTPSVQYVFFDKDSTIEHCQLGYADVSHQIPTTEQTTYHAYSVTKTFTALAILQLAEQQKLEIEQSARCYLPDFPYSPEITIKQLLTHSAGIPNPIPLNWIHLESEHTAFDRNAFFKKVFLQNSRLRSKPNDQFAYSNLGYVLLGQIIEQVSGLRYEDYVRTHILAPLKLKASEIEFAVAGASLHAKGYHKRTSFSYLLLGFLLDKRKYMAPAEGIWRPFKTFYVNGASYGGLIGTAQAFVRYLQELIKSNSVLISDDYKKELFVENHTNSGQRTGMCLAWFRGQLQGHEYFAHAGGGGGYYCELRIYPAKEMGSVLMMNRTGFKDERYLDNLDKFLIYMQ
ncbi:serine hydrolase domain-containing protein [Hymenobacter sp. BT770]|uniref:serine hydrolase domain-containing protein n=1 Tax=Hymenobacter sp. BT770 TaxID=2886942 RepID=UPI001D0F5B07|nr:serine hydrolase domain-containing protein [Hymenobacter sp. BT770]MCC3153593.1 beta-lactamase family protein [Hymenobacter sp. BT770]MDO3415829.1 serine hydrolase domain-containing protein [Hymenobacter sp. BT770]